MTSESKKVISLLVSMQNEEKALHAQLFFKTKKGEYGHGDQFLGITVPEIRKLAKMYSTLKLNEIALLLSNKWHEIRLLGLILLTNEYQATKKDEVRQKEIFHFYMNARSHINNWDLVDTSCYKIIGHHLYHYYSANDRKSILHDLINSTHHWDRRIAVVATLYFIKKNESKLTFDLCLMLLNADEKEDLMHKAAGWMLREVGKISPEEKLKLMNFINKHGPKMPRTMLRYAIEKFSDRERATFLKIKRV